MTNERLGSDISVHHEMEKSTFGEIVMFVTKLWDIVMELDG